MVKCLSSRNSDEAGTKKTIVDSLCIQSTPPHYADRNYELLERVGTCYGFGRRYRRRYKFLFDSVFIIKKKIRLIFFLKKPKLVQINWF